MPKFITVMSGNNSGPLPPVTPITVSVTIPYPATQGTSGFVNFGVLMVGKPTSYQAPGQRVSGYWLELTNDTDSALLVTFQLNPQQIMLAPGDRRTLPIPLDENTFNWTILYQNPTPNHPAQQLTPIIYTTADLGDGYPIQNSQGTVNPSVAAGSIGPGLLPTGVIARDVFQPVFNVKTHLASPAVGDGITDDTTAVQNTLAALISAGGGILFFPKGSYLLSSGLVITIDGVTIMGEGAGSILLAKSGFTADMIATGIPSVAGTSGFIRHYINVTDLTINMASAAGTTQGQGNAIHYYGCRFCTVARVQINSCPNYGVVLDGDNSSPGFNFGFNNLLSFVEINNGAAGIVITGCEANYIVNCELQFASSSTAANQPAFGLLGNAAYLLWLTSGYNEVRGCILGNQGTYTTPACFVQNIEERIIGNRFDNCLNQAIKLASGSNMIIGNEFGACGSANTGVPTIDMGSTQNIIANNNYQTVGTIHYTFCIQETGGPRAGNVIIGNNFVAGTSGVLSLDPSTTVAVAHNPNYNPIGNVTAPAVPTSGTPLTNHFGTDATIYIETTGTLTSVAIAGVVTGATTGTYRLPSGQTITLVYSVATPTWTWYLD